MDIQYAGSMPRFFVVQFKDEIEKWANATPVNPSNESINIVGVVLMRRIWNDVMHVSPHAQMDEWMLHRWDAGFVDAADAETSRRKL